MPAFELQEADFKPIHPGLQIKFALAAQNISHKDFAKACGITVQVSESLLKGEYPLDDTTLENARGILGNAWKPVRDAKTIHDYYAKHQKLPTTDYLLTHP